MRLIPYLVQIASCKDNIYSDKMGKDDEKASWNLSQLLIIEIGDLLRKSSDAYVKGRYSKAFENLKAVSMRIVSYLDVDEYKILIDMESKMVLFSRGSKMKEPFGKRTKISLLAESKLQKYLDDYNKIVFSFLKKYGLLIPARKDMTNMQA